MNQSQFINGFSSVNSNYQWSVLNGRHLGTVQGVAGYFNPVTALCHAYLNCTLPNTKRGTLAAAKRLGLSAELAMAIYNTSNMGHSQVIRGKITRLLKLNAKNKAVKRLATT